MHVETRPYDRLSTIGGVQRRLENRQFVEAAINAALISGTLNVSQTRIPELSMSTNGRASYEWHIVQCTPAMDVLLSANFTSRRSDCNHGMRKTFVVIEEETITID
jgi:hypothetical protein